VYFRNELPKTNVGKILRRALRDELKERAAELSAQTAAALAPPAKAPKPK